MSVRPTDIAKALNLTKQALNHWLRKGMPTSSIQEAEAFYYSRIQRSSDGQVETIEPATEVADEFSKRVQRQMSTVDDAWQEWDTARRNQDSDQNKLYATYDKAVKMLITLQREEHSRKIASKELIRSATALAIFTKVLGNVRTELLQLGTRVSAAANPDHPGMALKAVDDEVNRMLKRISGQEEAAVASMTEPMPIEVTTEGPDEVQKDETGEV